MVSLTGPRCLRLVRSCCFAGLPGKVGHLRFFPASGLRWSVQSPVLFRAMQSPRQSEYPVIGSHQVRQCSPGLSDPQWAQGGGERPPAQPGNGRWLSLFCRAAPDLALGSAVASTDPFMSPPHCLQWVPIPPDVAAFPPPSRPTPSCPQTLPRYDPRHPWALTSVLWVLVRLPSRLFLATPIGGPHRCPSGVASGVECHGPCLGLRSTGQPQPLPPMPSECSLGARGLACVLNSRTSVCRAPAGSRAGQTSAVRPWDADLEALCAGRSPVPGS